MKFTVHTAFASLFDSNELMIHMKTFSHAVEAVNYRNYVLNKNHASVQWVMIVPERGNLFFVVYMLNKSSGRFTLHKINLTSWLPYGILSM